MAISITEALALIEAHIPPLQSETVPIETCVNRVSATDIQAHYNLPRFDNSAMDGYAIKCSDSGNTVNITSTLYAGDSPQFTLNEGEAIKIMTGAPTPQGCEAIVPIEAVKEKNNTITLPENIKMGNFIRCVGEDITKDTVCIQKGEVLSAYHVAILASQGLTNISVIKKTNVALFATGDELKHHSKTIEPHQLYNSNTPMLQARLKELGCNVAVVKSIDDDLKSLKNTINTLKNVDVILTSGGISTGDKDFTRTAFLELGMKPLFYKVDIKPGKPIGIGLLESTVVINLPGNPLAAMVNCELFTRAVLAKLKGESQNYPSQKLVPLTDDIHTKGGRETIVLGELDENGFTPLSVQKPGMIAPLSKTNAMTIIASDQMVIKKNNLIKIVLL